MTASAARRMGVACFPNRWNRAARRSALSQSSACIASLRPASLVSSLTLRHSSNRLRLSNRQHHRHYNTFADQVGVLAKAHSTYIELADIRRHKEEMRL